MIEYITQEPQGVHNDPIETHNCGQQVVAEDAVLEQKVEGPDEDIRKER